MKPGAPDWTDCNSPRELSPQAIHVWRVRMDHACFEPEQVLSDDEKERAGRFYFDSDRHRFSVARGALRAILGGYLGMEPKRVKFDYGAQGKPFLADAASPIRFNLSHSRDCALVAVSCGRDVGVDVEFVRALAGGGQIPERFFSSREAEALRALPEPLRERAFFVCWTRKEAYIKARGGGLSIPLDGFEVSVDPREPAALLAVRDDPAAAAQWGIVELFPADGFVAALAARGKDWRYYCYDWPLSTASVFPPGVPCEPWRQKPEG